MVSIFFIRIFKHFQRVMNCIISSFKIAERDYVVVKDVCFVRTLCGCGGSGSGGGGSGV